MRSISREPAARPAAHLQSLLAPIGATVLFQSVGISSPLIIGGLLFVLCGVMAASRLVRATPAT